MDINDIETIKSALNIIITDETEGDGVTTFYIKLYWNEEFISQDTIRIKDA